MKLLGSKFLGSTIAECVFVKILNSPVVVPSPNVTAKAEPLLPIMRVAAESAAPFAVISS